MAPICLASAICARNNRKNREPLWHGLGAAELGAVGGWTLAGETGWNLGGRAGLWFAVSPSLSVQLGAGLTLHDGGRWAAVATIGVARLIRIQ